MDFDITPEWKSKDDWRSVGSELHDGEIKNNGFEISEGKTFSHYMKKFKDRKFKSVNIKAEVPEPEKSEVWLRVKTSDQPDFEDIKGEKSFELKDGEFEEELDLDWGEFTFFKVLPEREGAEVESPRIESIELQTEADPEDVEQETHEPQTESESVEDIDEEEMPAFEDVEYKDLECPECGEEFKTDIGLKVHRKVNHPEEYKENPEPDVKETSKEKDSDS